MLEIDLEELELNFIDFGVDEVIKDEDGEVILYSSFENYGSIQKELENQGIEIISSEFERIPKQMKELSDNRKEEVNILIEKIEEDDDIQNVFHNMN
jgi:transcriptional/translational regulatory protein YebC/TACO1